VKSVRDLLEMAMRSDGGEGAFLLVSPAPQADRSTAVGAAAGSRQAEYPARPMPSKATRMGVKLSMRLTVRAGR
jgi:hypothetical protein